MLNHEQMEKIALLVNQHTEQAQKWGRWFAMYNSGIAAYLIHHDESFGWETYWARFHRLQDYAAAKMAECLKQEQAIGDEIKAIYEGA